MSGMQVLLLGINGRYSHSNLALRYLRNEVEAERHSTRLLEFEITSKRQDILEAIVGAGSASASGGASSPDVVLISVYVWNALLVRSLLPDIRTLLPEARLILGGPEVSYSAAEWLRSRPEVDCVVCGAGEQAVRELARRDFDSEGRRIYSVPNRPFGEIPFPYQENELASMPYRYIYYESSRGCPCACSYCVSGRDDQPPEFRSLEQTLHELKRILAAERRLPSPPIVKFVDRTFNADQERARAIWSFLCSVESEAVFHFEVHPAFLQDEDFAVLGDAPAGRFQFEIGVQSVHRRTLKEVRRAGDWPRSRPAVERVLELGTVTVHLDMIVGLPHDGPNEIAESIDDLLALKPQRFEIGFLKSLPGTAISAGAAETGLLTMQDPPYHVLSTDRLEIGDIARLRDIEQLTDAVWNAARLERQLDALAARCGGYYAALVFLREQAASKGYNLATRRRHKVEAFVNECLAECSGEPSGTPGGGSTVAGGAAGCSDA